MPAPTDPPAQEWRRSRLTAHDDRSGETSPILAVADLHNHSLLSDGRGDPDTAFAKMRAAGLHVAALTDHASIPRHALDGLSQWQYPDPQALSIARTAPSSIDDDAWARTGRLADAHDVPGEFTALRGFEWTEPWLGHVNIWFSDTYATVTSPGSMEDLFAFVGQRQPQALFGYNHPGREAGELAGFVRPDDELPRRMVSLEVFNRRDDYLFSPRPGSRESPIVTCLDAGWRPALIGCSDEHGTDYGLIGKGRTGLWVDSVSRDGVRRALLARRAFATREIGLRLDARLDGHRGGAMLDRPRVGACEHEITVDVGAESLGDLEVELQLITGRSGRVEVIDRRSAGCGETVSYPVAVPAETGWVALRVADPARPYAGPRGQGPAPSDHACANWALAYASPWYLSRA